MSHSLTASPPRPFLCSVSSILSSFLAFPTCCIHYQPLLMHIYCLQRARLIQHAAAESKSSPFPRLTCSLVYCRGQHKHLLFTVWFIYELSLLTFCLHPFPRVGRMPGLINCGLLCPAEASSYILYIRTHTHTHTHTHTRTYTHSQAPSRHLHRLPRSHVYACTWLYYLRGKHNMKNPFTGRTMPLLLQSFFHKSRLPSQGLANINVSS